MNIKFRKDSYSRVVIFATQFSTIAKTHMEKNTARFYLPNWFFGSMKSFNSLLDIFVNCTIYTIHSKWTPKKFRKVLSWKKLQYGESFPTRHSRKRDRSTQRPPSQNPVFLISHTNSVFLHSRKRPALATDTFFTSRECPLTRASTMYCALCINGELLSSTKKCVQQFTPGTQNYGQILSASRLI